MFVNKSIRVILVTVTMILIPLAFCSVAQEKIAPEVAILESRFSTMEPTVGEPFKYFLKFDVKDGVTVVPVEHFTTNKLTIVEQKALPPQEFQGRTIQQYEYTLMAQQAGQRQFRPISLNYLGPRQNPTAAETDAVQLTIAPLVTVQVVTNSPVMLNEKLALSLSVIKGKPVTLTAMPPTLEAILQPSAPQGGGKIMQQIEAAAQARKTGTPPSQVTPKAAGTPTPTPAVLRFELDQTQKIVPQQAADGKTVEQYRYTLAVLPQRAGEYVMPAFAVTYRTNGGEENQATTEPTSIFVLHPNTGNLAIQTDYRFLIAPAMVLAAIVLTGFGVWLFLKYRQPRRRESVSLAPPLPPGELAQRELAWIQAQKLPAKGEFKQYYTLVSEAVRKFLGAEFGFPVLERTTEEVLEDIHKRDVPESVRQRTISFLQDADLVKFAKYLPTLAEADTAMAQAVNIVAESVAYHRPQLIVEEMSLAAKNAKGREEIGIENG